jgi:hypothetical protein
LEKEEKNGTNNIDAVNLCKYEKVYSGDDRDDYRVTLDYNEKGIYFWIICV